MTWIPWMLASFPTLTEHIDWVWLVRPMLGGWW